MNSISVALLNFSEASIGSAILLSGPGSHDIDCFRTIVRTKFTILTKLFTDQQKIQGTLLDVGNSGKKKAQKHKYFWPVTVRWGIKAGQNVWKTSQPEHLGPDPDCVPVLRFLGMNLERVDADRSAEFDLPVGPILLNQMEYIIEVLMNSSPSLQLKTRTTSGNRESFATKPTTASPTEEEHAECLTLFQALVREEIVEIDALEKKNTKLHYNSEQNLINLLAIVGCLNWIALRTRPDIAWATSRTASLIIHDPDTRFIRVKHICQYPHHTLGYGGIAKPNWARREMKFAADEKRDPDLRWDREGNLPPPAVPPPVEIPPQQGQQQQAHQQEQYPSCAAAVMMHGPAPTMRQSSYRHSAACPTVPKGC